MEIGVPQFTRLPMNRSRTWWISGLVIEAHCGRPVPLEILDFFGLI
jgi:hypothetical protein